MSIMTAGIFAKAWRREQFGLGGRLLRGRLKPGTTPCAGHDGVFDRRRTPARSKRLMTHLGSDRLHVHLEGTFSGSNWS